MGQQIRAGHPPVHFAWWAHICRFLSVCSDWSKNQTKLKAPDRCAPLLIANLSWLLTEILNLRFMKLAGGLFSMTRCMHAFSSLLCIFQWCTLVIKVHHFKTWCTFVETWCTLVVHFDGGALCPVFVPDWDYRPGPIFTWNLSYVFCGGALWNFANICPICWRNFVPKDLLHRVGLHMEKMRLTFAFLPIAILTSCLWNSRKISMFTISNPFGYFIEFLR